MRFWKAFGGLLTFIGCLAALAGLLATAAPMVDNEQMRRIIESFSLASSDAMLNTINGLILFCLRYNYYVFGGGAALLLIGGLIKTMATRAMDPSDHKADRATTTSVRSATASVPRQPTAASSAAEPVFIPRPVAGTSPYTAAQYGKALAAGKAGDEASDIAKKYMPRSIISVEDEPYVTPALQQEVGTGEKEKPQVADHPNNASSGLASVLSGVIICPACGEENPVNLAFCNECGSKLPARLSILAADAKQAAKTNAERTPEQVAPTGKPAEALASAMESAPETLFKPDVNQPYAASSQLQESQALKQSPVAPPMEEPLPWTEWTAGQANVFRHAKDNKERKATTPEAIEPVQTVEARFQAPEMEDIRVNGDWSRLERDTSASAVVSSPRTMAGSQKATDAAGMTGARQFHRPMMEAPAESEPFRAAADNVVSKTLAQNNAPYAGASLPQVTQAERHVGSGAVASPKKAAVRPHIVSTIHAMAVEAATRTMLEDTAGIAANEMKPTADTPIETRVDQPLQETPTGNPVQPTALGAKQPARPRIVSTMGKRNL